MRRQAAVVAMMLGLALPAVAQDTPPAPEEDGGALLRDFLDRLGPVLEGLRDRLGDLSNYEAPEVLPNGDILIRRKPAVPDPQPGPAPGPEGEIEL